MKLYSRYRLSNEEILIRSSVDKSPGVKSKAKLMHNLKTKRYELLLSNPKTTDSKSADNLIMVYYQTNTASILLPLLQLRLRIQRTKGIYFNLYNRKIYIILFKSHIPLLTHWSRNPKHFSVNNLTIVFNMTNIMFWSFVYSFPYIYNVQTFLDLSCL